MKFNLTIAAITIAVLSTGCNKQGNTPNLDLSVKMSADDINKMVYIVNYDTKEKFDSAMVANDTIAHFSSMVETPFYARLYLGDRRHCNLILEPGTIVVDEEGNVTGSELNNQLSALNNRINQLGNIIYNDSVSEATADSARAVIGALQDSAIAQQNIVGFTQILDYCYEMSAAEFAEFLAKYPYYSNFQNVKRMVESKNAYASTDVGKQFADFSIEYADSTYKFSDYVGKGKYTLVDFWASWCGPCRREMKNIKEVYNKYNGKGLDVLGVAVWDKPDDTKTAVEQLQLPWQQIMNAQDIPTNLYGIMGIPHIILFDPQGTVVARNLNGTTLINTVDSVMANPTFQLPSTEPATTSGE
ncbi:MAG: AhpC/TSA family protein [Muribaculum sp.]|nr:AhpC/TSA family protein [Muribaculaceae bacterium]MCM1080593.1 AhpC/TSA family protein [Muribaculum sp.]